MNPPMYCQRCGAALQPGARFCSNCAQQVSTVFVYRPVTIIQTITEPTPPPAPAPQLEAPPRRMSGRLLLGIVFLPAVFAWFTLRQGYTSRTRAAAFVWMLIVIGITFNDPSKQSSQPKPVNSLSSPSVASSPSLTFSPTLGPTPTPYDMKFIDAELITHIFKNSPLEPYQIKAAVAGPKCDVLLVQFFGVNMLAEMVEGLHVGRGQYGHFLPGGTGTLMETGKFRGAVYQNAGVGADRKFWTMGSVQRSEVAGLKKCDKKPVR